MNAIDTPDFKVHMGTPPADPIAVMKSLHHPPDMISIGERLQLQRSELRKQDFKPAKESAEARLLAEAANTDLSRATERALEAIAAEETKELEAIAKEEARSQQLPKQGESEAYHEFQNRLSLALLGEQRELRAAIAANNDIVAIGAVDDPAGIEQVVMTALASGSATRVGQVAIVAESKLQRLAVAEVVNGEGAVRVAGPAAARVTAALREWRTKHEASSTTARRQAIVNRHLRRRQDIQRAADQAAKLLQLR